MIRRSIILAIFLGTICTNSLFAMAPNTTRITAIIKSSDYYIHIPSDPSSGGTVVKKNNLAQATTDDSGVGGTTDGTSGSQSSTEPSFTISAPTTDTSTDGAISGVDSSMEYSTDEGQTWKRVSGISIEGLAAGEVWIRQADVSQQSATSSEVAKIVLEPLTDSTSIEVPRTGDTHVLMLWAGVLIVAIATLGLVVVIGKKDI